MINRDYIEELLSGKGDLSKRKILLCKKYSLGRIPTNIEILLSAPQDMLPNLRSLQTKPTRSKSGVAVIAIMTRPYPCPHGKCSICPGGPDSAFGEVPQSYTGKEPAARRAIRNNFDPYLQVMNRLEQYIATGHSTDKIELIIMGGTFPSFPKRYQESFITGAYMALNDFSRMFYRKGEFDVVRFREFFLLPGNLEDKGREKEIQKRLLCLKRKSTLEAEKRKNEKARARCVSLVIETRPDYAKEEHIRMMLRLGATKVELGVQSLLDRSLLAIERGHTVQDTIEATRLLKDYGFKINYHMMPGLPGSTPESDRKMLRALFDDERFRPDMLKIYPCMIMKGTKLYKTWKDGGFSPIATAQAADIIIGLKKIVPPYVRIMRIQRDIPTSATEAGVDRTNLRQYISERMAKEGLVCNCIRCREVGRLDGKGRAIVHVLHYEASSGDEYFISADKGRALIGFARLRIPKGKRERPFINSAFLRELHVYGESARLGEEGIFQHKGWGKKLLSKAEQLAHKRHIRKLYVISGIGVRDYYRKFGYKKEGDYMVKIIS